MTAGLTEGIAMTENVLPTMSVPSATAVPARSANAIAVIGVLCVVAGIGVGLMAPALYMAAAAGLFVGGCVLVVGARVAESSIRQESLTAHTNELLAYLADREYRKGQ